jgi:hypothetical protein
VGTPSPSSLAATSDDFIEKVLQSKRISAADFNTSVDGRHPAAKRRHDSGKHLEHGQILTSRYQAR